jgi:hypothetical protein
MTSTLDRFLRANSRISRALLTLSVLCVFTPVPSDATPEIAIPQAESSIVFVEGAESGTGFAIRNRGTSTYILTSAHLLDKDRYDANALSPDASLRKATTDWLTVYDTHIGKPYVAGIVGAPDFVDDFIVLKVEGMSERPRTMCLASLVPSNPRFAISSFDVDVLQDPPFGKRLVPFSSVGTSTTPLRADTNEFQYASAIEKGFSGGPIYDTDSGAVFGLVRRSPYVSDPTTNTMVVSSNSHYGVSISAIEAYLRMLARIEPDLADIPTIDESDRRKLVPNLSGTLRLLAFDNIRSNNALHPVFRAYDGEIRTLLASRFGAPGLTAQIDPVTAVYPPDTPLTSIANICRMEDGSNAAGVVALRRVLSPGPGPRTVAARVGLVACNGHVIDRAILDDSSMTEHGPNDEQTQAFMKHLGAALDRLAGDNDQRLANFASDGLPLADAENRAFYALRQDAPTTYLTSGWTGGAGAAVSKIFDERPLLELSGISPQALTSLTAADLDRILDHSPAPLVAKLGAPGGTTTNVTLASNDRCAYLQRRKKNSSVDFISGLMKRETL